MFHISIQNDICFVIFVTSARSRHHELVVFACELVHMGVTKELLHGYYDLFTKTCIAKVENKRVPFVKM